VADIKFIDVFDQIASQKVPEKASRIKDILINL